jgi:hypothetical protein
VHVVEAGLDAYVGETLSHVPDHGGVGSDRSSAAARKEAGGDDEPKCRKDGGDKVGHLSVDGG